MKNCNEMVSSLLERRDRYAAQQNRKKAAVIRTVTSFGCVCVVALLSIGVWHSGLLSANKPNSGVYVGGNNTNEVLSGSDAGEESVPGGETQSGTPVGPNDICDMLGSVVVDGSTYLQFGTNMENYTLDTCLGAASDFEGTYQSYLKDIAGKLYTTKESSDVLIVTLENGGVVVLRKLDSNNEFVNLP